MKKKYIILFFLFFLVLNTINSQIIVKNLVENNSFEDIYNCPTGPHQIYLAKNWWGFGNDLLHICNTSFYGVPANKFGYQYPKTGHSYAHFIPYCYCGQFYPGLICSNGFIFSKLIQKPKKDKLYSFEIFVNLPESVEIQCTGVLLLDSIGLCFLKDSLSKDSVQILVINELVKPIINISLKGIDTLNWKKLRGYFVASGDEEYFAIGNFSKFIVGGTYADNGCMRLYVDNVSIYEYSFDINLGADTTLCEGESHILSPNLPNATYTWQDGSHAATFEVKQPGTYWVSAYVADYDVSSSDTIVITQGDYNYCNPPLTIPNVITPNGDGANDNFVIQNAESYNITLQIYNRWGNIIYECTNYQNDFNCSGCASGVYYYVIKAKSKRNGREKEYNGSLTIISN